LLFQQLEWILLCISMAWWDGLVSMSHYFIKWETWRPCTVNLSVSWCCSPHTIKLTLSWYHNQVTFDWFTLCSLSDISIFQLTARTWIVCPEGPQASESRPWNHIW
jgi:hypothetical protein